MDEYFEYFGKLNDEYLRRLMGKAITKRRSELLSLIRSKGAQPNYIDHDVWLRLQKLADSRLQQQKSKQARHANASRKTLGKTGPIGENGVRQNLREMLHRSPDPYEVEEEMQRVKGFGGRKRNSRATAMEEGNLEIQLFESPDKE